MQIQLKSGYQGSAAAEVLRTAVVESDPASQAHHLFDEGVRAVTFSEPIRLTGHAAWQALGLLRELAAWAVVCDWTLVVDAAGPGWSPFSHLPPPTEVRGCGAGGFDLTSWRESYLPCKCIYRAGPGFVQIRDRRSGWLECYTVDEPAFVAAIRDLATGLAVTEVDSAAAEAFMDSGLIVSVGDLQWWAPVRVRRWPIPAMSV